MNDKQQLADMGEHVASMKLTIHGHGINSEEEASGGFLTRCLPCSSQQQQTPCMAKRIEELEAQVRVMSGLLRDAQRYVQYRLDYTECDARIVMGLIYDIDAALAGKMPEPVYYMRDNHTFKRLSNDVDTAITEIEAELDAGWTSGMLCSKRKGFSSLHANYRRPREEFISDCRDAMLAAAPSPGDTK